jgi:hypothetical protein
MKILAFESGGDWTDATVEYMVNLTDLPGRYLLDYYSTFDVYGKTGKSFAQWCVESGFCRLPTDQELEVVNT